MVEVQLEDLRGVRISALDDSKVFLVILKNLLVSAGCEVTTYSSCIEAIARTPEEPCDIWIVDYEMPQMTGVEFIRQIRGTDCYKDVPILMLTGRSHGQVLVEAIQAGADAFLEKKQFNEVIFAQLLALVRLKKIYHDLIQVKQLGAIKALIGTYKHEFGNVLAIVNGKISKLERTHPSIQSDESLASVKNGLGRMGETLIKLDGLSNYQEEVYVDSDMTLNLKRTG